MNVPLVFSSLKKRGRTGFPTTNPEYVWCSLTLTVHLSHPVIFRRSRRAGAQNRVQTVVLVVVVVV